jgi:hypothetical protein
VSSLEAALKRISTELDTRGRRWALVGGLAVSARAEPRTTRDVDLVIEVTGDSDAENLILARSDNPDLAEARNALASIETRGYQRGRTLVDAFESFLREEGRTLEP